MRAKVFVLGALKELRILKVPIARKVCDGRWTAWSHRRASRQRFPSGGECGSHHQGRPHRAAGNGPAGGSLGRAVDGHQPDDFGAAGL